MEERLSLQTFEKYVLVYLGAVGRGSARAGASRPLRPKRLNPQMNRRDLSRRKLWRGQRRGCASAAFGERGTWSNLTCLSTVTIAATSRNRSFSVWLMRRGEANREAPARAEPRPTAPSDRALNTYETDRASKSAISLSAPAESLLSRRGCLATRSTGNSAKKSKENILHRR